MKRQWQVLLERFWGKNNEDSVNLNGLGLSISVLHVNFMFLSKEHFLFKKILQAISRTTGPNIGLFGFILMHFPCWFQIWAQYLTMLTFLNFFLQKWRCRLHYRAAWQGLNIHVSYMFQFEEDTRTSCTSPS